MAALATSGGGVSAPAAGAATASFRHPAYELVNGDRIERRADVPMPSTREGDEEEQRTVTEALVGYVTASMLSMGFKEHWIPDEEAPAKCPIYGTTNWHSAPRLLIVLINQVGGQPGLWSRSLCFSAGLKAGSMLACLSRAIDEGYGVLVLNPNTNSVMLSAEEAADAAAGSTGGGGGGGGNNAVEAGGDAKGDVQVKVSIPDSASAEEHAMAVWENLVLPASIDVVAAATSASDPDAAAAAASSSSSSASRQEVYLLAYGNGASLAKTILLRNMARMLNHSAYADAGEGAPAAAAGGGEAIASPPPGGSTAEEGGGSAQTKGDFAVAKRIVAVATIEASLLVENDDPQDIKSFIKNRFLNWEQPDVDETTQKMIDAPEGYRLQGGPSSARLGQCVRLSVGPVREDKKTGAGDGGGGGELPFKSHTAWSAGKAMDSVFRFFKFARQPVRRAAAASPLAGAVGNDGKKKTPAAADEGLGMAFARSEAERLKLDFASAVAGPSGGGGGGSKDNAVEDSAVAAGDKTGADKAGGGGITGMFSRMMSSVMSIAVESKAMDSKLKVADFDLLKVVGKGAFGKVMLVRKKTSPDKNGIFAMKVLKKSMIIAKGQVEHTASERSILHTIKHPYIVCLRYAFQSDEKLYLITDYYSGGSLFYHLRKARGFPEHRARFYAAELLLALSHLHSHGIVYRDLKLENVLMDHHGHIALTDFGLSKENVDGDVFEMQLSTFCGTAEYIAPELLKGQKYGAAVDWWSFGVLLYEMLGFKTPFFDKNRKLMFYNIINNEPQWQSHFSERATSCLRGLLMKPPTRRLGSGPDQDKEIMQHPFFEPVDFEKLAAKKLDPPFRPDVKNILDPKFVPKTYLQEPAKDSFDRNAKGATNVAFNDFTYQPDSVLDGGN